METLALARAAALLERQYALQAEAAALLAHLDLTRILSTVGATSRIGSSVLGLMVWRDIDFMVVSPGLSAAHAFEVLRPLLIHPRVTQARYLNESGSFNGIGLPRDERYYFALQYRPTDDTEWKIDISFWLGDAPRDEAAYMQTVARQLTEETRLAILWIKDEWHSLAIYRRDVGSMDIYDAVLEHGVRTPTEFELYLRARGKPAR